MVEIESQLQSRQDDKEDYMFLPLITSTIDDTEGHLVDHLVDTLSDTTTATRTDDNMLISGTPPPMDYLFETEMEEELVEQQTSTLSQTNLNKPKTMKRKYTKRNNNDVKKRQRTISPKGDCDRVKGPWSENEDENLLNAIQKYGGDNWKEISNSIYGRNVKQCRDRYKTKLDPSINHGAWSKEEDEMVLDLVNKIGRHWSKIAKYLPGRTENGTKSRYVSLMRVKFKVWTVEEENLVMNIKTNQPEMSFAQISKLHLPHRTMHSVKNQWEKLMLRSMSDNIQKGQFVSVAAVEADAVSTTTKSSTVKRFKSITADTAIKSSRATTKSGKTTTMGKEEDRQFMYVAAAASNSIGKEEDRQFISVAAAASNSIGKVKKEETFDLEIVDSTMKHFEVDELLALPIEDITPPTRPITTNVNQFKQENTKIRTTIAATITTTKRNIKSRLRTYRSSMENMVNILGMDPCTVDQRMLPHLPCSLA